MKKNITIALTWGWTGGHIFPLLAIYNYLKEENNNYDFVWVWEEWGLEQQIAEKNKIKFLRIAAWKIRRYFDTRNFYEPLKNITWVAEWIYYIWKYKIDIVFSKWGFVSIPLALAAKLMRKKIYIHESDTISWLSNRIVSKLATKIFYSFEKNILEKNEIISGQILNPALLDWLKSLEVWTNPRLKVVVIAGSQGSTTIFRNLLRILPDLQDIDFDIILWDKNLWFRNELNKFTNTKVYDFVDQKDLGLIYKNSDIAITRWWATSLWELYYFWIHSIIIPLKSAAQNHQEKNALYFKRNFGSNILDEDKNLHLEIFKLLQKYKNLRKAWINLESFFNPLKIIEREIKKP